MKVRAAVIGAGDGGMLNVHGLQEAGAEVVALCDINEDCLRLRSGELAAYPEMKFYTDHHQMLARLDVDLVVIATPDDKHMDLAVDCLVAGKRVFVEKPLATTIAHIRTFRGLADKCPGRILFGENQSFSRPIQAALRHRRELGAFMFGSTFYVMTGCDRIMGGGKWRTEHAYNPCAGGLSHNFMVALLFAESPIARVRATGSVLTYHENLDQYGGYDTMEGALEFASGRRLNWHVCIALREQDALFGERNMAHFFQCEHGVLSYGASPPFDRLVVRGQDIVFEPEPRSTRDEYYFAHLYCLMHRQTLAAMEGKPTLHTIDHGVNVAAACALAFESAKHGGSWVDVPDYFRF